MGTKSLFINPSEFIVSLDISSSILNNTINRYMNDLFFVFPEYSLPAPDSKFLQTLYISVASDSSDLYLGVDESYSLYMEEEHSYTCFLYSETIWGAIRGIETFSQLIDFDVDTKIYSFGSIPFYIADEPRFPWRGLLIDTSRHYLPPKTILRIIDTMSWNKMNTLHWHIVDAESFPLVIKSFPLLSQDSSWNKYAIYPIEFIKYVVDFAKERGVRVVIEIDMPGHAYSWGLGYPITAYCPQYSIEKDEISLNPTLNQTYDIINAILTDIDNVVDDAFIHLGGDEVNYDCWTSDPSILSWMNEHNQNLTQTMQMFYDIVGAQVSELNKTPLYWQDIWQNKIDVRLDSIFEVYSSNLMIEAILEDNKHVINAFGWYLDVQQSIPGYSVYEWVDTWKVMWSYDPLKYVNVTEEQASKFLGGEALMWGDQVDNTNIDSRIWPRACGVAERLWSPGLEFDVTGAKYRLVDFRCRLARRGIGAGPVDPDYCPLPSDFQFQFPGFE